MCGKHMNLRKCTIKDFDRITDFYKYSIDNTLAMKQYVLWVYGLHPTDEMIKAFIENGFMYCVEKDGQVIAAVAVTPFQGEEYHPIKWSVNLQDDEVMVLHIFCVDPRYQRQGVARMVLDDIVLLAKEAGIKALRLDALIQNEPARKLYEKYGFAERGTQTMDYDNTGRVEFVMYELVV